MTAMKGIKETVRLRATANEVWQLVGTADGIGKWFMENDLVAEKGRTFHLQSPFGPSPCKVLEADAPHKLTFSWEADGWIVTFLVEAAGSKTDFTLIHDGWKEPEDVVGKAGETTKVVHERMAEGWRDIVQDKLRKAVEEEKDEID